jgi:hypothetical protein
MGQENLLLSLCPLGTLVVLILVETSTPSKALSKGKKQNIDYVFANADYDILDIHLYDDPENWPEYLSVLPENKPILVSEFGGPNSEFECTDAAYQAVRMEQYIDAVEQLPIIEAYYFKLVESDSSYHKDSGLFYSNYTVKPARNVFAERLTPHK